MTTKTTTGSVPTLKDLLGVAGVETTDDLIRLIRTGKLLEDTLKNGRPVGFFPVTNGNSYYYKCIDFPLGDWLRYAGQISRDFHTPIDALNSYVRPN
jgi:hypothetical protein